jgi:hypothetical protein
MKLEKKLKFPSFTKRCTVYLPTIWGWISILLITIIVSIVFVKRIHSFLALNKPVAAGYLVVEGWLPDYCLEKVYMMFDKNGYKKIFVTGGPLDNGYFLKNYKDYATLGKESLLKIGIPDSVIISIPSPHVKKDRTFTSAIYLKNWIDSTGIDINAVNVVTLDVHARRSLMLFNKAIKKNILLGVVSLPNRDYDAIHWYKSSEGFKAVLNESLSFIYTLAFVLKKEKNKE